MSFSKNMPTEAEVRAHLMKRTPQITDDGREEYKLTMSDARLLSAETMKVKTYRAIRNKVVNEITEYAKCGLNNKSFDIAGIPQLMQELDSYGYVLSTDGTSTFVKVSW